MQTKQRDILAAQSNTEAEQSQNSPSQNDNIINEAIPNTPMRLVGSDELGYALTVGAYRVTEAAPTKEEALQKLETEKYNIMANITCIIIDTNEKWKLSKEDWEETKKEMENQR